MISLETAHCHLTVLNAMLQQITQIHEQIKDFRPPSMDAERYKKTVSDINAQRVAIQFAVDTLTEIYGPVPAIIDALVPRPVANDVEG